MAKRAKAEVCRQRRDYRRQAWRGSYCSKCGGRCLKGATICAECRGPLPYKKPQPTATPTTEYRDLLRGWVRRRLERLERREPLDGPGG